MYTGLKIQNDFTDKKRTDQPLPKRKQKIYNKRSRIEAKTSEGKRVTGMNKSYYKGFEGDKIK